MTRNSGVTLPLFTEEIDDGKAHRITAKEARPYIVAGHYLHTFPAAMSINYKCGDTIIVYGYSSNPYLQNYLFSADVGLLELRRLWAPDGHDRNALTKAIHLSLSALRSDYKTCQAVVAFADPVHDHHGGIYQAASWMYTGKSIGKQQGYRMPDGSVVARRSFHDAQGSYVPDLPPVLGEGKYRYVRCLTRHARHHFRLQSLSYPKPNER